MYNQQYNQPYSMNTRQSSIIWVQGLEGAKAYQLYPNSNALLMDSENDNMFYIKTSDNIGMCNLRAFKFEEVTDMPKQNNVDLSEYVRKDELNSLLREMINSGKQTISGTSISTESDT